MIICKDCEQNFVDKIKLSKTAATCLANPEKLVLAEKKVLNEIEKILVYHFTELIGKPTRMAKYIIDN